jgi:RimJ/RimL family protein N-acetyltransferase
MKSVFEPYAGTKKMFKKEGLNIIPATSDDLGEIRDLKFAVYDELCPKLANWYRKHMDVFEKEFKGPEEQDPEKRVFYSVRNLEDTLVGCGGLTQKDPKGSPWIGELMDIYLLKDCRGKGLGQVMIGDLIKKAKKLGFECLYLTTRKEFEAATHIYQKFGFRQTENKKYSSKNSTAWEMQL